MGSQLIFTWFLILTWTLYTEVEGLEKVNCKVGDDYTDVDPGGDCQKFLLCYNGFSAVGSCEVLERMNPETLTCSPILNTNCSAPSNRSSHLTPYCGPNEDKNRKPHPVVCGEYFECEKGVMQTRWCSWPMLFNSDTLKCDWEWKVDCNRTPSNHTTAAPTSTTPTSSSSYIPPSQPCMPDKDWQAPYPGDCKKYYKCQAGKLVVKSCFILQDFDPLSLKCKAFWEVDCTLAPTTTVLPSPQPTSSSQSKSYPSLSFSYLLILILCSITL